MANDAFSAIQRTLRGEENRCHALMPFRLFLARQRNPHSQHFARRSNVVFLQNIPSPLLEILSRFVMLHLVVGSFEKVPAL
jgi:hypothetical protein